MKGLFTSFLIFFAVVIQAQQEPHFVYGGFSPFWNNPASFGSWNKFSVNTAGALKSVGTGSTQKSIAINAEHCIDGIQNVDAMQNFHFGYGVNFIVEEIGFLRKIVIGVPINYQIKIKESFLSIGVAPGYRKLNFIPSWTPANSDPALPLPFFSESVFNLDAGLFWYGERFYSGLSSTQITEPNFNGYSSNRRYHFQGGYRFKIGKNYFFPQIQFAFNGASVGFWNLNYFQFKEDLFSIGLGASSTSSVMLEATARYKFFKIAYNFDWVFNPLSTYTNGSHQLRLSFFIEKNGKE